MSNNIRILRRKQVCDRTGLPTSTIYEKISKQEFPAPIKLGSGSAVGWVESEIDAYLERCIAASRGAR